MVCQLLLSIALSTTLPQYGLSIIAQHRAEHNSAPIWSVNYFSAPRPQYLKQLRIQQPGNVPEAETNIKP